jgi:hypothetical protein
MTAAARISRGLNPGRILLLVIAGLAIVLAIAAYASTRGDDQPSRAEYQARVVAARDRVSDALSYTAQSTSVDDVLNRLALTARVTTQSANELDKLGAPKGLEDEGGQLVAALTYFGGELDATVKGLRQTRRRVLENIESLDFKGYTRTQQALRALRARGIDVPLLARY